MCGLSGELRFDGRGANVDAVVRMTATMVPRGPDGVGVWSAGPVAFGHRRLKIIDLSECGAQPMVDNELGLTTVFNGCIYNYQELRDELIAAGYRFFSTSDTEVIGKAYHRWGRRCVDHFAGMFAFAIAERDSGRLILARDRLGIKPLYLTGNSERLRFASTLPALLAGGGVSSDIDLVAFHHYLSFHSVVPAPHTILAGVRKLPAATVRVVEPDGTSTDDLYWRPSFTRDPAHADWTARDWQDAIAERLRLAVRRRMVADVPVGVLLSGGLDSSLIVALLAEAGQKDLATFSVGFEAVGGEPGDEFVYSDVIARYFDTDHHQIRVPGTRLLPAVDAAVAAMSEPMVSHDCVAFYLLSQEVSRHVKVVQSGQGADEVFAGYSWYPPLAGVGRTDAVDAYLRVFADRPHRDLPAMVEPHHLIEADASRHFVASHFARPGAETAVDAALRIDSTIMLVDDPVKRVDNMTMAAGLEARTPFLDHELVELAAACPPELKLASGGKGVLKNIGRPLMPVDVIDRPKGYFPVPAIRHLDGPFLDRVREALTDPAAKARGLFRPVWVQTMLAAPNDNRTALGANALWQAALLEMWLQTHTVA
ncbi:asparagine synthase (glutamine-hydrolyzing) [Frankia casuarinae]|uniref:asparagine synthase (glutamine-hydrolyzing) n=1 Tax=Frankia casuarinae (strain DSM 45818 / CECT 9043 / HFP020203 / CcI3) TaxID=106370 RepID=Q2J8X4_FRACC|nr:MULTISPECIES: N-acetylglutaminylglutamine amidotransferase [Frankia]ABD12268.1 Asparagine synthase, glutamine-hydrolyzing [Frankia casuarinae]ETA01727.1 asparagine synthase (glutamine-hydrolyzing) [Frankia sp. CcI6]EYT91716.1 asparagine synthase (glutamine-hydrolyzing) [Frankia casuarinae]KFB03831.1 asparagine synthase, glutamine-hydrolyzing [Frankia sp. Allo2]OHV48500.1 asparagine synthase (glutamine-hydrolyzing) [Frankia sp. CgIS1]